MVLNGTSLEHSENIICASDVLDNADVLNTALDSKTSQHTLKLTHNRICPLHNVNKRYFIEAKARSFQPHQKAQTH